MFKPAGINYTQAMRVCIIVAHPDDEVLWAGGALLLHREWVCAIATLCRSSDADRAPRFRLAAQVLGAESATMADLDDGPEQRPLDPGEVEEAIASLAGARSYDLLITHSPRGEYTRHRRHEETARAVLSLARRGSLKAAELWLFAYDDAGRSRLPEAIPEAPVRFDLPDEVWRRKRAIVTDVYGFAAESWEARAAPRSEAFWRFADPREAERALVGDEESA